MTAPRAIRTTSRHMSGGSSGGSGTAVAGGLVPLALGSDTNGSIRVPSSLCGIFGLKPTYGRLSRARTFPFVASLDHLGPFARTVGDLALAYDAMLGPDADDPALADVAADPVDARRSNKGSAGCASPRSAAISPGTGEPAAFEAVERVAKALGAERVVEFPQAERARAAGLSHHHGGGRGAASRPAAQRAAAISIPTCATG